MPLQMFVYPVNPQAALPSEFIQYARESDQPASITPEVIALNRDHWISDWADIVLH
jgi:thiamine transport system substrate-binding protein